MNITSLPLAGAHLVGFDRQTDDRGSFERIFCRDSFLQQGLADCSRQNSLSINIKRGTLRGMHFQPPPHQEIKLVRCVSGAVFDVIVDIRWSSGTFGCWYGTELSQANGLGLYIPKGFAHGFVTLTNDAAILYQIADLHAPGVASGIAWDDLDVGVVWPIKPTIISAADRNRPTLKTSFAASPDQFA